MNSFCYVGKLKTTSVNGLKLLSKLISSASLSSPSSSSSLSFSPSLSRSCSSVSSLFISTPTFTFKFTPTSSSSLLRRYHPKLIADDWNWTSTICCKSFAKPSLISHQLCLHSTSSNSTVATSNRSTTTTSVSTTRTQEFHQAIESLLESIQLRLEEDDVEEYNIDLSYSSGVLAIKVPNIFNITSASKLTWILNQHNVTRQCWLSSPLSGPSKWNFDFATNDWIDERDRSRRLKHLLGEEFSHVFSKSICI